MRTERTNGSPDRARRTIRTLPCSRRSPRRTWPRRSLPSREDRRGGTEGEFLYEPKWDGFRAIVFRDASGVRIQSRDLKPLDRYFPELNAALREGLPARCVLDGEIVIAGAAGLDFDALLQRVHPASSRVQRLARETPASFVAFDLLGLEGRDLQQRSQSERRMLLEALMTDVGPPIHLTPMTESRAVALQWLHHFEGAGLDGVIAKRPMGPTCRANAPCSR
jgi:ATP-dependent DNA ligase